MNLLFLYSSEIIPQRGGVQRVTNDLTLYFTELGNKVIYLSTSNKSLNTKFYQYFLPGRKLHSKENLEFYLKLVTDNSIDIIINQDGMQEDVTRFCFRIKDFLHVKVITVIHNSLLGNILNYSYSHATQIKKIPIPYLSNLLKTKLIKRLLLFSYIKKYRKHYKYTLAKSDKIILLSESFLPELKVFVPKCDLSKISFISNPCDIKVKKVTPDKINELLYVGRLNTSQKRVDLLLEIWNKIYTKFPDWRLSIIGDGEEREKLESKSKKMGLMRIKFYGTQNPAPFYERAKILCMTSAYEGFPLVLAEAQIFGTIPIAFNSFASIKDIISDRENGLLVEPFNVEIYAEQLAELMINQEKIILMAKKCQKSANKFSLESIGEKWIDLFNILQSKKDE